MEKQSIRLTNLDILRAIAALLVCIFHFDRNGFSGIYLFSAVARNGFIGVDIFFVVSGFIIPFALERSNFRFKNISSFLASRFLRLYPAYLIAIIINILLWFLSAKMPGFRGANPSLTLNQVLSNLILICDFQGQDWLSPVFWTLAIEAQYYLLIAVSYPGLNNQFKVTRYIVLALWICAPCLIGVSPTVFSWTALFAMGILCFLQKVKKISRLFFLIFMVFAFLIHGLINGWLGATVGVLTSIFILYFPELNSQILVWVGMVSYSLYLVHVPFGGRIINLAERLPNIPAIRLIAIFIAITFSLIISSLFFRFIEQPSHSLSRQIRQKTG